MLFQSSNKVDNLEAVDYNRSERFSEYGYRWAAFITPTEKGLEMKRLLTIVLAAACLLACSCDLLKKDKNKYDLADTEWVASDDSYMTISKKMKMKWCMEEGDEDNYYAGKITFYQGEEAFEYVTEDLEEYGVEASELKHIIKKNDYSMDNLICLHIEYTAEVIDGEEIEIYNPDGYWYGIMEDDGESMMVVNMDTATEYNFEKV